jgi:hypothetical protein
MGYRNGFIRPSSHISPVIFAFLTRLSMLSVSLLHTFFWGNNDEDDWHSGPAGAGVLRYRLFANVSTAVGAAEAGYYRHAGGGKV